jgi:suppressor of fused
MKPEMKSGEIFAPGWDATDNALKPIYEGQAPKHYGTLISYELGGADPLRGISAYKRSDPIPHWHYITYGFSELYDKKSEKGSGWEAG